MVVVMYLIFIVSLCHFSCLVAFIKSNLILSYRIVFPAAIQAFETIIIQAS